ncbi:hypothetical protein AGMMS49965_08910 [Bacteroidia bacterium]|nr:hypothetical protein AGMMS49965_08910 [Bacteroidia bacterium]
MLNVMNKKKTFFRAAALAFALAAPVALEAKTIYVGDVWGPTKTNYSTLEDLVQAGKADKTKASAPEDEIWVATGTHELSAQWSLNEGNDGRWQGKLYGGFAGTETSVDQRAKGAYPWEFTNPTVIKLAANQPENQSILRGAKNDAKSFTDIDGFTFDGSNCTAAVIFIRNLHSTTITFRNNIVENGTNPGGGSGSNDSEAGGIQLGGKEGMEVLQGYPIEAGYVINGETIPAGDPRIGRRSATLNIDGCLIQNNKGVSGGGIYSYARNANTISNSKIIGNEATGKGGAVVIGTTRTAIINTIIADNKADSIGGVYVTATGLAVSEGAPVKQNEDNLYPSSIINSTIANNIAAKEGGVVYAKSAVNVYNTIFYNNKGNDVVNNAVDNLDNIDTNGNASDADYNINGTGANDVAETDATKLFDTDYKTVATGFAGLDNGKAGVTPQPKDILGNVRVSGVIDRGPFEIDAAAFSGYSTLASDKNAIEFAEILKGESATESVTVTLTTTYPGEELTAGGFSLKNNSTDAPFEISVAIISATTADVTVTYHPKTTGAHSDELIVKSQFAEDLRIVLTGTAKQSTLEAEKAEYEFADTKKGETSAEEEIKVTLTAVYSSEDILEEDNFTSSSDIFEVTDVSIDAAKLVATVKVVFKPTTAGQSYTGNLVVKSANAATLEVPLKGKAVAPVLTADPTALEFGNVQQTTSKSLTVVVTLTDYNEPLAESNFKLEKAALYETNDGVEIYKVESVDIDSESSDTESKATVTISFNPIADIGLFTDELIVTVPYATELRVALSGTETATGSNIPTVEANAKVYSEAGTLYIETVAAEAVKVYTVAGVQVFAQVVEGSASTSLPQGVYIVKVGQQSYKVIVR